MGQFAAVIVPQYCGAPAEKPVVLEWAIALEALEMAEQSQPFPGHPPVGWMGTCCQLGGPISSQPCIHAEVHPLHAGCAVQTNSPEEREESQQLC